MKQNQDEHQFYNNIDDSAKRNQSQSSYQKIQEQYQKQFSPFRTLNLEPCYIKQQSDSIEINQPSAFSSQKIRNNSESKHVHYEGLSPLGLKELTTPSEDNVLENYENEDLPDNNNIASREFIAKKSFKMGGFFKVMLTKRIILKFKQSLMQNANVLSKIYNPHLKKLLKEVYLGKKRKRQQQKRLVQKFEPTLKRTYTQLHNLLLATSQVQTKIKIPIFKPGNKMLVVWEVVKIFFILLIFWWGPFMISFNTLQVSQVSYAQDFLSIFFFLDILITLNKGFISQGSKIKSRKIIFFNYIQQEAFSDLSSLFCLGVLFYIQRYSEIVIFIYFYFNYQKINQGFKKIQESSYFQGTSTNVLDLVKLILVIFFFAHVIACIWNYVGFILIKQIRTHGETDGKSWIIQRGLDDNQPWTLYNQSFYWATMTMVTVGYGDITPTNDVEMIVANITMFVACGVFAFSVNSIGIVLQNINEGRMKFKRTLTLINNYMLRNEVTFELQSRVRNYLEYCFEQERELNDEQTHVLVSKLSTQLRQELLYQILSKVILNCKVISTNFSDETQRRISYLMEPVNFCPEEKILIQDQLDDGSMFIIQKGEVILYEEHSQKQLKILQKGESFGQVGFFTGRQRSCSISSKGFSRVYKIKRDILLDVIKDNKKELQTFHMIKDQMIYRKNYESACLRCYSCDQQNHLVVNCPSLRYIPDVERVIKQELYHSIQERNCSFQRKSKLAKISKSMINMKLFQESGKLFKRQSEQGSEDDSDREIPDFIQSGTVSLNVLDSMQVPFFEPLNSFRESHSLKIQESNLDTDLNDLNEPDSALYKAQTMIGTFVKKHPASGLMQTPSFNDNTMQSDHSHAVLQQPSLPIRRQQALNLLGNYQQVPPIDRQKVVRALDKKQISLLVPDVSYHTQNIQVSQSHDGQPNYPSINSIIDSRQSLNLNQYIQKDQLKLAGTPTNPNDKKIKNQPNRKQTNQSRSPIEDRGVFFAQDYNDHDQSELYSPNIMQKYHVPNQATQKGSSSRISTSKPSFNRQATNTQKKGSKQIQFDHSGSDKEDDKELFSLDMDCMKPYQYYFPSNNVEVVCKKYARFQRNRLKYKLSLQDEKLMHKYTFSFEVIRRVTRIKHYIKAQDKANDLSIKRNINHEKTKKLDIFKNLILNEKGKKPSIST